MDSYKFSKLNNIQTAIMCQIKVQEFQYPFSGITGSKEMSDEKYQGRGGPHNDFHDCSPGFQLSGLRDILYLATFPSLVTA